MSESPFEFRFNGKPGLKEIVEAPATKQVAVKVTGFNSGTINYLISKSAERLGLETEATYKFADDGHLKSVTVSLDGKRVKTIRPQDYIAFLYNTIDSCTEDEYLERFLEVQ